MSEKKKRNVIIISLCSILLLMTIGYAAFNTLLTINGTTSITSNWDIKITNIKENTKEGDATDEGPQVVDDLSATFKVNLVSPGDYITYDVTIENNGNIDAELNKIILPQLNNEAILITTTGLAAGDELLADHSATLTVKIEYNPEVTKQPENKTASFEMKLDYVQKNKAEAPAQTLLSMKGVEVPILAGEEESDGLYADEYEPGRYVYKGAKPNNYITFNGETWRIIAIETDGTIKIMHQGTVRDGEVQFDAIGARDSGYCGKGSAPENGCNAWAKTTNFHDALNQYSGDVDGDSNMKKYLNGTYYDSITKNKTAIQNHIFYYGSAEQGNNDLANQIKTEKEFGIASNIGLIQASDFIKANSDANLCGTFSKNNSNYEVCKPKNYMVNWMSSGRYWMITPNSIAGAVRSTSIELYVHSDGHIIDNYANYSYSLVPSLYLKSDVELSGTGAEGDPFTIENYIE